MKILLVDNCSETQEELTKLFNKKECKLEYTNTAYTAIQKLEKENYDLIIMDWLLPFATGKMLIDWLHENGNETRLWIYSMFPQDRIKKYTNGHKLLTKGKDSIVSELNNYINLRKYDGKYYIPA